MKSKKISALALSSLFFITACNNLPGANKPTPTPTTPATTITTQVTQTPATGQTIEVSIEMGDHSFSVPGIIAPAGATVKINLSNKEGTHDFVIDELGVNSGMMNPGDTKTVTFVVPADAAGKSFKYYCSVSNHRLLGMEGTLSV